MAWTLAYYHTRRARRRGDYEDIVADMFQSIALYAMREHRRYDPKWSYATWLKIIARTVQNHQDTYAKAARRRPIGRVQSLDAEIPEQFLWDRSTGTSDPESLEWLSRAMVSLPHSLRRSLSVSYGLVENPGVKPKTIRVQGAEGLKRLKQLAESGVPLESLPSPPPPRRSLKPAGLPTGIKQTTSGRYRVRVGAPRAENGGKSVALCLGVFDTVEEAVAAIAAYRDKHPAKERFGGVEAVRRLAAERRRVFAISDKNKLRVRIPVAGEEFTLFHLGRFKTRGAAHEAGVAALAQFEAASKITPLAPRLHFTRESGVLVLGALSVLAPFCPPNFLPGPPAILSQSCRRE